MAWERIQMASKMGFLLIGILFFIASPLFALNSELNRTSLQGLKGIRVLVEDLNPEVERSGLTKAGLQKEVEGWLRAAGIRILSEGEAAQVPGDPYLYLNLNISLPKREEEPCAYSIDIGLIQNVTLIRNPRETTYGITWSSGGVGLIGKKSLPQLKESVEDIVNIFIKAYFSVNPKK